MIIQKTQDEYSLKGKIKLVSDITKHKNRYKFGKLGKFVSSFEDGNGVEYDIPLGILPSLIERADMAYGSRCRIDRKYTRYRSFKTLLEMRYGLNKGGKMVSYKDIGDFYGISKERVRQLYLVILRDLYILYNRGTDKADGY